jgi:hypothetical protein
MACCAGCATIDGHDCVDVRGALVHLSLSSITDPEIRARLPAIPTGLTIPDTDADLLVNEGEELVRHHQAIRELVADLEGPVAAVAMSGK